MSRSDSQKVFGTLVQNEPCDLKGSIRERGDPRAPHLLSYLLFPIYQSRNVKVSCLMQCMIYFFHLKVWHFKNGPRFAF